MGRKVYAGIDIGTTYTCVYYEIEGSRGDYLFRYKNNAIRSAIHYFSDGRTIVGEAATAENYVLDGNTVMNVKRVMGQKFGSNHVREAARSCRAKMREDEHGNVAFDIPALQREISAEDVYADILNYVWNALKVRVEGYEIACVTVTYPTVFRNEGYQAIVRAVEKSKISCKVRYLNEPSAAAIALGNQISRDGLYVIYDLGGGTYDLSLVNVKGGKCFDFISSGGDVRIGGQLFDDKLVDFVNKEYMSLYDDDIMDFNDRNEKRRLRNYTKLVEMCREGKEGLSTSSAATLDISSFQNKLFDGMDVEDDRLEEGGMMVVEDSIVLTRARLNEIIKEDISKTVDILKTCLREKNKRNNDVEGVILVGGSSNLCIVQEELRKEFGDRCKIGEDLNTMVAKGACRYAQDDSLVDLNLKHYAPYDICTMVKVRGRAPFFEPIIPRGMELPTPVIKKEYKVNREDMIDIIGEGYADQPNTMTNLKYFEYLNLPKRLPVYLDYYFQMMEDRTIIYWVQDRASGAMLQERTVISRDNVDSIHCIR